MKKYILVPICIVELLTSLVLNADDLQPKYGPKGDPKAIPLAVSNDYFRDPEQKATAFWSLISNYIPQTTVASCASATLAMTLNAARAHRERTASDANITEKALWDSIDGSLWKEKANEPKYQGTSHGLSLDQLGKISEAAFKKYGFPKVKVKVIHASNQSGSFRSGLIQDLKSLSDHSFIMANFNQKVFTNDADIGHFAPVGAYDEKRGRVLILDPDRGSLNLDGYYEPYWVSLDTFVEGLATLDSGTKTNRGYILIRDGGD